jgi:hypothetical protein
VLADMYLGRDLDSALRSPLDDIILARADQALVPVPRYIVSYAGIEAPTRRLICNIWLSN